MYILVLSDTYNLQPVPDWPSPLWLLSAGWVTPPKSSSHCLTGLTPAWLRSLTYWIDSLLFSMSFTRRRFKSSLLRFLTSLILYPHHLCVDIFQDGTPHLMLDFSLLLIDIPDT